MHFMRSFTFRDVFETRRAFDGREISRGDDDGVERFDARDGGVETGADEG